MGSTSGSLWLFSLLRLSNSSIWIKWDICEVRLSSPCVQLLLGTFLDKSFGPCGGISIWAEERLVIDHEQRLWEAQKRRQLIVGSRSLGNCPSRSENQANSGRTSWMEETTQFRSLGSETSWARSAGELIWGCQKGLRKGNTRGRTGLYFNGIWYRVGQEFGTAGAQELLWDRNIPAKSTSDTWWQGLGKVLSGLCCWVSSFFEASGDVPARTISRCSALRLVLFS